MCLNRLGSFPVKRNFGYKLLYEFDIRGTIISRKTYKSYLYKNSELLFELNIWQNAIRKRLFTDSTIEEYYSGFHIFYEYKDAIKLWEDASESNIFAGAVPKECIGVSLVLMKVEFKEYITGYGDGFLIENDNSKQIVSKNMMIHGESLFAKKLDFK